MRPYECVFIIDPKVEGDEAIEAVIQRMAKVVTDNGGEVTNIDKWGRKRLAYEIKHNTEGYYVVLQFNGGNQTASELERILRISDDVLRHLLVRQDV